MSCELYESLEEDLHSCLQEVKVNLERKLPYASGEEKKLLVRDTEKKLDDAKKLADSMESETHEAPPQFRIQMCSKVRNYRQDIQSLFNKLTKLNDPFEELSTSRHALLDLDGADDPYWNSNRQTVLEGAAVLERTSDSINRCQVVAAETVEVGHEILNDLGSQRDALTRTRDRLGETDQELDRSKKLLKTIRRRVIGNKFLLIVIIILELGLLAAVVYWKFFKK